MDSSVSPKDEIWFLRVCHHISVGLYLAAADKVGCIRHVRLAVNCIMTHRQVLANCSGHQNCFSNSASLISLLSTECCFWVCFDILCRAFFFCMNSSEVWFSGEKISSYGGADKS